MRENLTLLLATNNATDQPDQISGFILHSLRRKVQVSIIRIFQNHTVQTNPRQYEVITSHKEDKKSKATGLSLPHQNDFKTRKDTNNAQQNTEQPQNNRRTTQWGQNSTTDQYQQKHSRTDISLSHWGLKCILQLQNLRPRFSSC